MAKKHFEIPIGKKTLGDTDFNNRVAKKFSRNIRESLDIKIYDLSTANEAEALALVLEHSPAFAQQDQEKDCYIFRVDRQELQELIDLPYDLVKYEIGGIKYIIPVAMPVPRYCGITEVL